MAAQAAAAAQHGNAGNKHSNPEGAYDYSEKRQKVDESPQGQLNSPSFYPQAYPSTARPIHGLPAS